MSFSAYAIRFLLLGTILAHHLEAPASSQGSESDPKAIGIVAQAFAAMGGASLHTINDLKVLGNITVQRAIGTVSGTAVFKQIGDSMYRVDYQLGTDIETEVVNGSRGAILRNGIPKRLPYHALLTKRFSVLPVFTELAVSNVQTYAILLQGIATLNGQPVYRIRMEKRFPLEPTDKARILSNLSAVDYLIDTDSLLVLAESREVPTSGDMQNTVSISRYYSDYRAVGPVLVPHQVSTYVRGQKAMDLAVTVVVFNSGVNPLDFEVR